MSDITVKKLVGLAAPLADWCKSLAGFGIAWFARYAARRFGNSYATLARSRAFTSLPAPLRGNDSVSVTYFGIL